MSLLDKASIVWPKGAPSKAGFVANWNPQTGALVDFPVTRATTKTYVDSDRLIKTAAANVLPRDFTNGGCGDWAIETQETIVIGSYGNFSVGSNLTLNTTLTNDFQGSYDTFVIQSTGGNTNNGDNRYTAANGAGTFNSTAFTGSFFKLILKRTSAGTHNFGYTGGHSFSVNLDTGVITGGDYQEFINLGNDYYQVNVGFNSAPTGSAFSRLTALSPAGVGVTLWHISGEYNPSSSIIINTTSATRNADVPALTGASALLGQASGGIFIELAWFDASQESRLTLSDGSSSNRIIIYNPSTQIRVFSSSNSVVNPILLGTTPSDNTFQKVGIRYAVNNAALYIDGLQEDTSSSFNTYANNNLTQFKFQGALGLNAFEGRIRQIFIFKEAPTDAQLAAITTP